MEHHAHTIHAAAPSTLMTNFISVVCYFIAFSCEILKNTTGEDIYNFLFRFLSIVSLGLVIIINWPKAKEQIKKSFKNRKLWKKKKKGI